MRWLEVEFQGHRYRVPAVKHQGRLWFHWRGETHVLDSSGAARRTAGEAGSIRSGVIVAPMPGKVTRVSVKKGDLVKRGQMLVVMEAMKMEYTLEADRDGRVEEVRMQTGQQAALGEVLVRVVDA